MTQTRPTPRRLEMVFDASIGEVGIVLDTITALLTACNVPEETRFDVNIVLSEMLSNSIRHGVQNDEGWIGCGISLTDAHVECRVSDPSAPFSPPLQGKSYPEPDDLAEGGYGWPLILSLAREVQYRRLDGRNELSFRLPFHDMDTRVA